MWLRRLGLCPNPWMPSLGQVVRLLHHHRFLQQKGPKLYVINQSSSRIFINIKLMSHYIQLDSIKHPLYTMQPTPPKREIKQPSPARELPTSKMAIPKTSAQSSEKASLSKVHIALHYVYRISPTSVLYQN